MIWQFYPDSDLQGWSQYNPLVAKILQNRKITIAEADSFINSPQPHDFQLLHQIDHAVATINNALKNCEKICIYGDYDVDGVSATHILFNYLYRKRSADVFPFIPSRFEDGYGLNKQSLKQIQEKGAKLVITVDCGARDGKLVQEFSDAGLDFIISDHHGFSDNPDDFPSSAKAVVHPMHPDGKYPQQGICAASVAYKIVQALDVELGTLESDEYLDIVALASVCDVMPLLGENRYFVKRGLERIKNKPNLGLAELFKVAELSHTEADAYHLGFVLGPRLNAAGRLDSALESLRLLTSGDAQTIAHTAKQLDELNKQRQELTAKLLAEAEEQWQNRPQSEKIIFVSGKEWPEGVVGLVAGKLCEKYNKPVLVASWQSDGRAVGSARSVSGWHITEMLGELRDFFERFGGHAQAAGFTLKSDDPKFHEALIEQSQAIDDELLQKKILIDAILNDEDLAIETVYQLDKLAPFGYGNPKPNFMLKSAVVKSHRLLGKNNDHIKLELKLGDKYIEAIGFNMAAEMKDLPQHIDVVGNLEINSWRGQDNLQFKIKDWRDNGAL